MESNLAPAGLMGQYYAARSRHGHYRSCAITARYIFPAHLDIPKSLKQALHKTIQRHPSLCYSLTTKSENSDVHFIRLPSISWHDVVELQTSNSAHGNEDAILSEQLSLGHERLFNDPYKPIWRLLVLNHGSGSSENEVSVDIAFFIHHALGDGRSGAAFHNTLLEALQETSPLSIKEAHWPFIVPPKIPAPISLEEALAFTPPPPSSPSTNPQNPYTFSPPTLKTYTSLVSILTIPPSHLTFILTFCRTHGITLTGLLHSLLVLHLSKTLPLAHSFRALTPYSLRRHTHLPSSEIANHISLITTLFTPSLLHSSRQTAENTPEETGLILQISTQFQSEIQSELSLIPERGPLILDMIGRIGDFDRYCEEGMARERGETYELSNIGVVEMPEGRKGGVRVEKMVFSQCGMVAGPAFGCSVVSLRGGPLTVCLHWQEGVVEDEFIVSLRGFLERRLLSLGAIS